MSEQRPQGMDEAQRIDKFVNGEMGDYSLLPKTPTKPQVFRYQTPDTRGRPRVIKRLGLADVLFAGVQVLQPGAGNVMHSHSGMDGLYFVLKGRIRFYGEGDVLLGEFGPHEGVVMPRDTPYWFEAAGDEEAEMLHVEAFDRRVANRKKLFSGPKLTVATE